MLSILGKERQDSLRELFGLSEADEALLPSLPEAFDSHCHLDRIPRKLKSMRLSAPSESLESLGEHCP